MKPRDDYRNGDDSGSDSDGSSGSGGGGGAFDAELSLHDPQAPLRALAALNALRKSRQHFDVVLLAGGCEVAAHRALLAAASPYLLHALAAPPSGGSPPAVVQGGSGDEPPSAAVYRVDDVAPDALRSLVEWVYTGRARVAEAAGARRLYLAAWRLRVEPLRAHLADRLAARARLAPHDVLETRALPGLRPPHLDQLDAYIAERFDEVCAAGALTTLPLVRMELLRASSAHGGEEAPTKVADAALAWLRDHNATDEIEEVCSRTHLVFVDAAGALRDCGELPANRGDAPELRQYRAAAALRRDKAAAAAAGGAARAPPRPLPGLELGARAPNSDCKVLAARGGRVDDGAPRVTRALLTLRGRLVAARIAWRDVGGGEGAGGGVAVGGPLGGAREPDEGAGRRAPLTVGRCAHGAAALGGRLLVCGGYDRAEVLKAAEAYHPAHNQWRALPDMRTARARFPAARLGDALYVVGGSDGHNELDSVDVYEEKAEGGGAWRTVARLPLAASHCGLAADGARDELWVVGGWAGGRSLRATWRYSPRGAGEGGGWREGPPLGAGRSQCAAVVWDGWVWALGGCDAWHCVATTERLRLGCEAAQWEACPALPTARRSVGGVEWRGRLASCGGSDGASSLRRTDWLVSAGGGGAWSPGPDMRRARAALGLVVLDDVLYAVGGFDGKEFLSCVECLYEPEGEWTTLLAPPPRAAIPCSPPTQRLNENGVGDTHEASEADKAQEVQHVTKALADSALSEAGEAAEAGEAH